MNTWNTIKTKCVTALDQAIFILEMLSHPDNIPIIEYFSENGEASLLDLAVGTGYDASFLEEQLDLLMQTRVIQADANIYGNKYHINYQRIAQVNTIAALLSDGK